MIKQKNDEMGENDMINGNFVYELYLKEFIEGKSKAKYVIGDIVFLRCKAKKATIDVISRRGERFEIAMEELFYKLQEKIDNRIKAANKIILDLVLEFR